MIIALSTLDGYYKVRKGWEQRVVRIEKLPKSDFRVTYYDGKKIIIPANRVKNYEEA